MTDFGLTTLGRWNALSVILTQIVCRDDHLGGNDLDWENDVD